ncbi:hypothetical protein G9A89_008260 [Geosiphon pyriformis]|nr:hypothetical protein G9A89_008260 [Geosiphon pyriformis]
MTILNGQRPKITFLLISPSIAEMIIKCWNANSKNRPIAKEVYEELNRLPYSFKFMKSEKYIKESTKGDGLTTTTSIYLSISYVKTAASFRLHNIATIGPSIAVLNRSVIELSFDIGVKFVESKKKRRGGALENNIGNKKFAAAKVLSDYFWGSKAGNTIESNSVNMEEECLIEETSFDHGDSRAFARKNSEQTPKSSKILIKRTLGKPLKKINFLGDNIDDILLDKPVVFPPSLKNLVNISVRKSFALDISLDNIVGKSVQEKLVVVRKLFSRINGFGGASTPSKFAGIVRAMFTSKSSLAQTSKKTEEMKILVNFDLRKPSGHLDQAVVLKKILIGTSTEAVRAALSEFGIIKLIKMQLTLLYTLPVGTNVHDIWDYIALVGGKTCVINHHPVSYAQVKCATVCFDSAKSLDTVLETMFVLKRTNLCWSHLVSAKCAACGKLGHTLLFCPVSGKKNVLSGASLCKTLLDLDKSRLAAIYAKHLAPVAHSVSFGGVSWAQIAGGFSFPPPPVWNVLLKASFSLEIKPTPLVSLELDNRFATLERSLTSFVEHVDMLAKSPGCQPLVTSLSQNQEVDIVMSKDSGVATGGETVVKVTAVVLKKILIGTSTEAVRAALSEFGIIKLIKMQLIEHINLVAACWSILIRKDAVCVARFDTLLYTLPVGTNVHDIWDYIALVGGKTCVINHHPVSYAQVKCATVCFDSAKSLDTVLETMFVLKRTNLCWSHLVSAKCAACGKLGHTLLFCPVSGKKNVLSGASLCKTLLDLDKSRLAAIYAKHLAPVAHSVSFGGVSWAQIAGGFSFPPPPVWNVLLKASFSLEIKPTPLVSLELDNRFATLERSLTSFVEHVDMLAKRLETPEPTNQEVDIVMSKDSGVATGGESVAEVVVFNPAVILKMEETLNSLSLMVMNLSAKLDNTDSVYDIIHWHKEKDNLVSIFTESKLKGKVCPWIVNKFNSVRVFTSGLESGNLGAGVVVVMNFSLAKHVCKISEVPGWLLSIKLLFRNKLSVSILGLYTSASLVAWFSQTSNINSLIAKAVNESFFVIFRGDFNEDSSRKCASFKKCLNFGLVNALDESSSKKLPIWSNF